jgi:hypothetical protein
MTINLDTCLRWSCPTQHSIQIEARGTEAQRRYTTLPSKSKKRITHIALPTLTMWVLNTILAKALIERFSSHKEASLTVHLHKLIQYQVRN